MNEHEKLIAEAKRRARKRRGAGWLEEADMLDRLITALEAATRERDAALTAAGVAPQEAEKDERVLAWEQVAAHPAIRRCYAEERPLLPAVLDRLTALFEIEQAVTELASAPEQIPLDPEKVAEVLNQHEPIFKDRQYAGRCICGFEHPSYSGWRLHRSNALCEAYTEGKLR